jgi:hypothetical protein
MYYLLNSLPNALLPTLGKSCKITGISLKDACDYLLTEDYDQPFDDTVLPMKLHNNVVSAVGHYATAQLFSYLFSQEVWAKYKYELLPVLVPVNRIEVKLNEGDKLICGLFVSPRRLGLGEQWTEDEIMNTPVSWVLVEFSTPASVDITRFI